MEKMQLRFDDLLERHYNNATRLELDQVCWFLVIMNRGFSLLTILLSR